MNKIVLSKFLMVALAGFVLFGSSCTTTKKTKYFQNLPDSGQISSIHGPVYSPPKIHPDDLLNILILTVDPKATEALALGNVSSTNMPVIPGTSNIAATVTAGYLVDKEGNVELPVLGKIKLEGLTTYEARDVVSNAANKYFKNASASVRFANFKIDVTGEVNRPSTYIFPNEKVTLIDALTIAGDLTIYGKRDNVLLIRTNDDGSKSFHRFDLKNKETLSSPYYYLRQNDVIYVEPSKSKAAANDVAQARNITIITSVLSVIIVYLTRR